MSVMSTKTTDTYTGAMSAKEGIGHYVKHVVWSLSLAAVPIFFGWWLITLVRCFIK